MIKNLIKPDKEHLLDASPRPLLDNKICVGIFWTLKSGCTFITKWFFYQIGHYKAAEDYYNVHYYRDHVYYNSNLYQHSRTAYEQNNKIFRTIKIVRNPYSRAVSSYFQLISMLSKENESALSFIQDLPKNKITFDVFVNLLMEKDIYTCNKHWRSQVHPLERIKAIKIDHIIDLSDAEKTLKEIEKAMGLKESKLGDLKKSNHHSKILPKQKNEYVGNKVFGIGDFLHRPSYKYFYDEELCKKIEDIYKIDFETYGYEKSLDYAAQ